MCDKCEAVDVLVAEVNEGKRTFDAQVLRATLLQINHVIGEVIEDIDAGTKPLHELLHEASTTMQNLGIALFSNARMVHRAAAAEIGRLVELATEAEKERADRKHLVNHIINQHNADGDYDPAKLLLAELAELQAVHHQAHLPHIDVPDSHLVDGR